MSHWIGTTSPSDAGMNDFKECLKNLRDGQSEEALQHARRALGIAPKNPFYLSYTGLLAALARPRNRFAELKRGGRDGRPRQATRPALRTGGTSVQKTQRLTTHTQPYPAI